MHVVVPNLKLSTPVPITVFTSICFMITVNSYVFMQYSKHEETGIIFTTGGQ